MSEGEATVSKHPSRLRDIARQFPTDAKRALKDVRLNFLFGELAEPVKDIIDAASQLRGETNSVKLDQLAAKVVAAFDDGYIINGKVLVEDENFYRRLDKEIHHCLLKLLARLVANAQGNLEAFIAGNTGYEYIVAYLRNIIATGLFCADKQKKIDNAYLYRMRRFLKDCGFPDEYLEKTVEFTGLKALEPDDTKHYLDFLKGKSGSDVVLDA